MSEVQNNNIVHNNIDTSRLMKIIASNPDTFFAKNSYALNNMAPMPLADYLYSFINKNGITIPQLIIDSNLSKSYVYQILAGEKSPGRDVLLRLSLALKMNLKETQHLLTIGDVGILYPKVRRDAAIICCILRGFDLHATDNFLDSVGERTFL